MASEIVRGRVPTDLRREFLAIAAHRGLNESAAINLLVRQFVEREKELQRRNEETLDALADIEAGLLVDGDKVLDWIASWGTEDEKEPPR
jgi:predicted transcriptional regulator